MQAETKRQDLVSALERIAALLASQAAGPKQVAAFRDGARSLKHARTEVLTDSFTPRVRDLREALDLNADVAACVIQLARCRRCLLLDRLEGRLSAEEHVLGVASMGPTLARRAVATLGSHTFEEVVVAAEEGRLARVPGLGTVRAGRMAGQGRFLLDPFHDVEGSEPGDCEPGQEQEVSDRLLALDDEYRRGARGGFLPKIAPAKDNPMCEAFVPVLHAEGTGWTAMAHFAYRSRTVAEGPPETRDCVLVYLRQHGRERQRVVCSSAVAAPQGYVARNYKVAA